MTHFLTKCIAPSRVTPWIVHADRTHTTPSPFTSHKTTSRDMYTIARERVGIKTMAEPQEVLIISNGQNPRLDANNSANIVITSAEGDIMEGSLTSVYFFRNGRWVTPPLSSGGQAGTTRRWLLEKGLCEEEKVNVESLVDGEECWISNGVRGLIWGKVKL